jgi:hypothetical protein
MFRNSLGAVAIHPPEALPLNATLPVPLRPIYLAAYTAIGHADEPFNGNAALRAQLLA